MFGENRVQEAREKISLFSSSRLPGKIELPLIGHLQRNKALHHFLWEALEEVSHPQHGFFVDFYRELDRFIGEFAGRLEDGAPFIMLSDHGFGRVRSEVNLNVFLRQQGYLSFSKERPETFEEMDATSRAFVLDPARVYLHMEGRYPRGCVRASEYEGLRAALKEEFLALKVDGRPVVRDVRFREEIYHGECLGSAPDMVLLPHEGFDLKGTIRQQELCGRGTLTGGHTRENALFFINRSGSCRVVNIVDVGATLAELLQVPSRASVLTTGPVSSATWRHAETAPLSLR